MDTEEFDAPVVVCASCLTSFVGFHNNQANDCDSTAREEDEGTVVTCGYGSRHDLMRFTFQSQRFPTGNLCDDCIERAVKEGFLTKVECYAYAYPEKPMLEMIRDNFPNLTAHDMIAIAPLYQK